MKRSLPILLFLYLSNWLNAQSACDSLLTLFYTFENNINDQSGNQYHGTLQGLAQVTEFLSILPDEESALIVPSEAINGALNFTLSFRVYFDEFNTEPTATWGHQPLNTIASGWFENNAFNFAYHFIENQMYMAFEGTQFYFDLNTALEENQWYCMAITRTGNIIRVYVDGIQISLNEAVSNNPVQLAENGFILGQDQDCLMGCYELNHSLKGRLDNFRIYKRALAQNELMNFCLPTIIEATICEGKEYLGYTETGIYEDNLIAENGCDSVRILHLTVTGAPDSFEAATICEGESYQGYFTTGTYKTFFPMPIGCDSVYTLELTVLPNFEYEEQITICEGEDYDGYRNSGIYIDTMPAPNGCDSIRTLKLTVSPVFIPNVFSPNGDGFNDRFQIFAKDNNLRVHQFYIFNRWGGKIYENGNFKINDYQAWWDGTSNGEALNAGIYVYYFELGCFEKIVPFKGEIVILK